LVANAASPAVPTSISTETAPVAPETATVAPKSSTKATTTPAKAAPEAAALEARPSRWSKPRFGHPLFCVSPAAKSTTKAAWFPAGHEATSFNVYTDPAIFDTNAIRFFVGRCIDEKALQR
jgi:hypothetical protein